MVFGLLTAIVGGCGRAESAARAGAAKRRHAALHCRFRRSAPYGVCPGRSDRASWSRPIDGAQWHHLGAVRMGRVRDDWANDQYCCASSQPNGHTGRRRPLARRTSDPGSRYRLDRRLSWETRVPGRDERRRIRRTGRLPASDTADIMRLIFMQDVGGLSMSEKVYPVPAEWASRAWIDWVKYQEMYKRSITDPDGFWGEMGKRIDWIKPYTKVKNTSFDPHNVSIKWFEDGTLNICYNCVDRHLEKRGDQ